MVRNANTETIQPRACTANSTRIPPLFSLMRTRTHTHARTHARTRHALSLALSFSSSFPFFLCQIVILSRSINLVRTRKYRKFAKNQLSRDLDSHWTLAKTVVSSIYIYTVFILLSPITEDHRKRTRDSLFLSAIFAIFTRIMSEYLSESESERVREWESERVREREREREKRNKK